MPEIASIHPIQTENLLLRNNNTPLTPELSLSSVSDSMVSSPHSNRSSTGSGIFLDHSHLKPGRDASLLSHAQTINMYRENAKKTDNPDIEYDLAVFLMEVAQQQQSQDSTTKKEYLSEAEKILKQLSIKGHANAQYQLGKLFAAGLLSKKGNPELDKAFSLFVQASKHCHAEAANR